MRNIAKFDEIISKVQGGDEVEYNNTLMWAYRDSLETGNEIIDFHEVIWDYDYDAIVNELREAGETEFSISCKSCGLMDNIAAFLERGCTLAGMTTAKMRYTTTNFETWETTQAIENAMLIRL